MEPLIPLFWTSADICLEFQSQGGSLACMLSHLHAMDSSDSPVVRYVMVVSMAAKLISLREETTVKHPVLTVYKK